MNEKQDDDSSYFIEQLSVILDLMAGTQPPSCIYLDNRLYMPALNLNPFNQFVIHQYDLILCTFKPNWLSINNLAT